MFNQEPEGRRILGALRNKKGRIILIPIVKKRLEWHGMGWVSLAEGRDRWRAVINVGMNLRVS